MTDNEEFINSLGVEDETMQEDLDKIRNSIEDEDEMDSILTIAKRQIYTGENVNIDVLKLIENSDELKNEDKRFVKLEILTHLINSLKVTIIDLETVTADVELLEETVNELYKSLISNSKKFTSMLVKLIILKFQQEILNNLTKRDLTEYSSDTLSAKFLNLNIKSNNVQNYTAKDIKTLVRTVDILFSRPQLIVRKVIGLEKMNIEIKGFNSSFIASIDSSFILNFLEKNESVSNETQSIVLKEEIKRELTYTLMGGTEDV